MNRATALLVLSLVAAVTAAREGDNGGLGYNNTVLSPAHIENQVRVGVDALMPATPAHGRRASGVDDGAQ